MALFPRVRAVQDYLMAQCLGHDVPLIENEVLDDTLDRVLDA